MPFDPVAIVTREAPRIYVNMEWEETPEGEISLWMKRAGDPTEFAYYPALEVWGNRLTFQFDDILFSKPPGRYVCRLLVAGVHKANVEIEYRSTTKVVSVENANV